MRPLSLAIEGLTSFREPQEIDFSKLDLFVITGPTGAGKSSILDAMTFALFGRVARVNSHEMRDLISHGCADMRVRLDFQVDGAHYRVARRMGRSRHDVSLERIVNGGSTPELDRGGVQAVNDRLEQIVGLDFGAFTKAVLLPQGEFHEFLKGDKAERRRILTRLLDLNRYERAGQAARREATRLEAIIGEREALIESNYQDATKGHLSELKEAVKAARDEHAKLEQARDEGRKCAKAAADASQVIAVLAETARQLEEADAELERLTEAWSSLGAGVGVAEEGLAQAKAAVSEAERTLEQARKRLAATSKRTGDSALLARLEEAASIFSREKEEITEFEATLAAARGEVTRLSEALRVAKRDHDDKKKAAKDKAQECKDAQGAQQLAMAIAEGAKRAEALTKLEKQLAPARLKAQALQEEMEQARKHLLHLEQEHAALVLRAALEPGDNCPVCESIVETLPEVDRHIDVLLAQARDAVEDTETRGRQAKEAAVSLEAQHQVAAEELEKARAGLPKKIELPSLKAATAALANAKLAAAAAENAEANASTLLEQAIGHLADTKTQAATATEKVEGLASKVADAKGRMQDAQDTLTNGFGGKLPREIDAAIAKRREVLSEAERETNEATEALEGTRQAREDAQAATAAVAERVSAFDEKLATVRTTARIACDSLSRTLEDLLPAIPPDDAERAGAMASWRECCAGHLAAARDAIATKEAEATTAARKLEELAASAGLTVAGADPTAIEAELEQTVTEAHGVVVSAEKDVETLKTRIEERKQMEDAITGDRHLRVLYDALARDLRADHFLAWVLEESMNQLADQASIELLRISDDRYSLVADSGNFDVIDHHNADERRSVATLSGGETFLASLSLALALAAGLRELAGTSGGRLDAIYIDEGFGALDPETLDVVVDALERLREGDRMVGVITHVPTLADRIPTGLIVEKNGGSSRVLVR